MSDRFVDPVVADVHAARAAMLEAAGGEIAELMRRVVEHQQCSHHRIIREPLRNRPELAHAPEPRSGLCGIEVSPAAAR